MIKLIKVDKKAIHNEIIDYKKLMEKYPEMWSQHEIVGRCLRYLKDPMAHNHFQIYLSNQPLMKDHPDTYFTQGVIYRLNEEPIKSLECFEQARTLYTARVQKQPFDSDLQNLIQICFLVQKDEDIPELATLLKKIDPDTDILAFDVVQLAEARHQQDVKLAAKAVTQFEKNIRRYRAKIWDTGTGPTLWDWYEIAVDTWEQLSGEKAER